MKRIILTMAAALLALTLSAQSAQKQQTFESFSAITVSGDFEVTLVPGTEYSATLTVDQAILPYVQCFVNNGTLIISVGKLPKEVKKLFKGRKAPKPAYYVTIMAPKLGTVTLADNVTLVGTSAFPAGQFALNLSGKAQVRHLSVEDAASAQVTMSKNAIADFTVDADNFTANLSNSASLRLNFNVEKLNISAKNSANVVANGDAGSSVISGDGSAKMTVSGTSEDGVEFNGAGSSSIDALNLKTSKATVVLTGGSLIEAASDELSVELSGKSTLMFDKDPDIKVVSIKTSTMTHYGNR